MIDLDLAFRSDIPFLDVRSPIEYRKGAFPTASNLPIMTDEQRDLVGKCYKEEGSDAAEALGFSLVDKQQLLLGWSTFLQEHPEAMLYCFRGGRRSQICEQWLRDLGLKVERIPGGYKAMRQHLLKVLETPPPITLISGKTGVGKTELLVRFSNAVDLEGLANHRGSAFGRQRTEQPTQIQFENELAIKLLKQPGAMALEDESRLIGRISLPVPLQEAMSRAPILLLDDTLENRVQRILNEYVVQQIAEITIDEKDQEHEPVDILKEQFLTSLKAIQKRLGGDRYKHLTDIMTRAFRDQSEHGDVTGHKDWISLLLSDYYDPMYEYQLSKKKDRVVSTVDWHHLPDESLLDLTSSCGEAFERIR